mgnify:CR=1 FL=1
MRIGYRMWLVYSPVGGGMSVVEARAAETPRGGCADRAELSPFASLWSEPVCAAHARRRPCPLEALALSRRIVEHHLRG